MVKEEKVKKELHCEDYGSCQKWEGGKKRNVTVAIREVTFLLMI